MVKEYGMVVKDYGRTKMSAVKRWLEELMEESYENGYRNGCSYWGSVNDCPTYSNDMLTESWMRGYDDAVAERQERDASRF